MKISCIDIGGTYIKSGVLEDGVLTDVEETPTDGGGGARAMLSRVAQLVRQTPGVERVGVSTAGEVDARTGVIRLSDNIPGYTGLNPRQILEGELGLPVATLLDTKGVLEFASRSWNFVTPGTGHDAAWWRRFLETLQDCGYDGALSIEQEDYTIPLEEALQKAVSLLRQALPA